MRWLPLFLLLTTPASAHTQWANGDPVPAWVKSQCCGATEVHHLTPSQVHEVAGGFRIDGFPNLIPYNKLLPSHDADWWAFYPEGATEVRCFFGPMNT